MRKFTLLHLFIIVTVAACTCAYVTRRPNNATRRVNLDPDRERATPRLSRENQNAAHRRVLIQTQLAILKSPFVLRAALRNTSNHPTIQDLLTQKLEKKTNPVEWLHENLHVEALDDQLIAEVSLTSYEFSRDELELILNSISTAYHDEILQAERSLSASR